MPLLPANIAPHRHAAPNQTTLLTSMMEDTNSRAKRDQPEARAPECRRSAGEQCLRPSIPATGTSEAELPETAAETAPKAFNKQASQSDCVYWRTMALGAIQGLGVFFFTWLLQTWLFANFTRMHSFALFCTLSRSFTLVCGFAFVLFCAHLRSFAVIYVFLRLTAFRTTAFGNCRRDLTHRVCSEIGEVGPNAGRHACLPASVT